MAGTRESPKPVSVKGFTAARMLDIHYDTLAKLIDEGVFTVISPDGRGRGKRLFLLVDEIEVYGRTRSAEAVREFRQSKEATPAT
jgi:hypothetical protein